MDELIDRLEALAAELPAGSALAAASDASPRETVRALQAAGLLLRRAEALVTAVAGAVEQRSSAPDRNERLTTRLGCRGTSELIERTVRCGGRRSAAFVRAARVVGRTTSLTTGELLPGRFPALHACLADGTIGIDGLLAATSPLLDAEHRIGTPDRQAADAYLAAAARGHADEEDATDWLATATPGFPSTPDDLALFARRIVDRLDPDGEEPDDDGADRGRSLQLGRVRRGLVPFRGWMMPEVAAQFTRIADSILNPRAGEPVAFRPLGTPPEDALDDSEFARDPRTRPQKLHDALATALTVAAASGDLPTLGGAAPTLVVTVSAEAYERGVGRATLDAAEVPVSLRAARHVACGGTVQRVLLDPNGRIRALATSDRIFNAWQRRAIVARDRECIIPGCHVPAAWCEVHHVQEHARGGPTHTDNGVLVCWHHHRTLEVSGWEIRMRDGIPEVRPPVWWDPQRRWRPAHSRIGPRRGTG